MAKKRKKKTASKRRTRKKTATKRASFKVPALSTLVKQPKRSLETAKNRIETAIEVKAAPGLFDASGKRLRIGPKRRGGRRKSAQQLPPEIAHIFK